MPSQRREPMIQGMKTPYTKELEMSRIATLEMDIDGGVNVLLGEAMGIEVTIPAIFIQQNGLLSEDEADWFEDAVTVADLIALILDRKGYDFSRPRLGDIVRDLMVPGPPHDPANFQLELIQVPA